MTTLRNVTLAAAVLFASVAHAQTPVARECTGEIQNPASSATKWKEADLNNQQCATAGLQMLQDNTAAKAAIEANAASGEKFSGDPVPGTATLGGQARQLPGTDVEGSRGDLVACRAVRSPRS